MSPTKRLLQQLGLLALATLSVVTASTQAQAPGAPPAPPRAPAPPQPPGVGRAEGPGDGSALIERLMAADANHDGKLSRDEAPPQFAERGFERADTNQDGFVDRAELVVFVQSQPRGPGGEGRAGRGGQPQNLEGSMKQVERSVKGLQKSSFTAESRASDLDLVQSLQAGLVASKGRAGDVSMSKQAKAKFGEDTAAFQLAFRRDFIRALNEAIALENAVLDGKSAEAKAIVAKFEKIQEAGHSLFQEEEAEGAERGTGGNRERRRPAGAGSEG
jgi:uncharacterized coiled-coil protein SlyX